MTFFNLLSKPSHLIGATFSSAVLALSSLSLAASAAPVAQVPSQTTPDTIMIPATGSMVQLSQIRVASTPPAPQNPCPRIYYENPHNQQIVVPQVCRPNLITQQLEELGLLSEIRARGSANLRESSSGVNSPSYSPSAPY